MPPVGFELTISQSQQARGPHTYALDHVATGTGDDYYAPP